MRHADRNSTLSGRLQRTLLAVLLVHANRPVPTGVLTDVLWPDAADRRAEQNLRLHVHRLRRTLGDADRLAFESGGYRLSVLPGELDAERFESLADEAAQIAGQEPQRGVELIRKAMGLWRGRAYEGLDLPTVADEAERLEDRRLTATEQLYEAELASGRDAAVVSELSDLVRRHPLRERLHGLLMTALYRAGRQAEALRAYQDARRTLVDELGLEPGPELRAIEQQVLAGEPVNLGPTESAPSIPAQLPVNVRGFIGRDDQIAALDRLSADGGLSTVIATLSGTAGVGKTALAVWWAHRVRDRFPDGQLYVDLRGFGPDDPLVPADALAGFLRALGVDGAAIPQGLEERAAAYRSLLADRQVLVVLDNARTVDQVRPLLPGSPNSVVLMTSRDDLAGLGAREGAHRIDLDRMPLEESRRLMVDLLGDQLAADDALDELIGQCARLPLALRIAADLVRSRPARGVAGLIDELADERDRLDLLDVEDDPYSAVRSVFSWSYRQLSPDAARLFRMCGLHPGREIDTYALTALAGSDRRSARRHLNTLVRAHLLDETAGGRFRPHDLLRAYAKELGTEVDTAADRSDAVARLSDYYLQVVAAAMDIIRPDEPNRRPTVRRSASDVPALSTHDQAMAWIDLELPNLMALSELDVDGVDAFVTTLIGLLWRYFEMSGRYTDGLDLSARALAFAKRRDDPIAEAQASRVMADLHSYLGDYDSAAASYEHALALYRAHENRQGEVSTLINLGSTYNQYGRHQEALRCYEHVMAMREDVGDHPIMSVLANSGSVYRALGQHELALSHFERALRLSADLKDRVGRGTILSHLADTYLRAGRYDDAQSIAQEALTLARETSARTVEMDALWVLGRVHGLRGRIDDAVDCHRGVLEIAGATGHQQAVARSLNGLGMASQLAGSPADAIEHHREALDVATTIRDREQTAVAHAGLGDAYVDLGDSDAARQHWRHGLEIYRELGVPGAGELETKLDGLH